MSRWAADPEAAADALIVRSLDEIGLGVGRVLLINQGGSLPSVLEARGVAFTVWNRRLVQGLPAAPWPPSGPFDLAMVRLPKARDEQAMTVHAAASVLRAGARMAVYGGNDEGIRGAAAILHEVAHVAETIAARGHGRVLVSRMPERSMLRAPLAAWRTVTPLEIAGTVRDWVSYPGTFAAGRLDEGTALLLTVLPHLGSGARVLDYGCGTGPVAAALLSVEPSLALDALDNDTLALEAARENLPGARLILGTRIADAGRRVYQAILSNPPLHQGTAEDHAQLESLIANAKSHLAPGGLLQLVVQRRVPLERLLASSFGKAEVVAENGRYRVWRAIRT
jgi:16S rRNA (guanine1207-N2)-methyltransferase